MRSIYVLIAVLAFSSFALNEDLKKTYDLSRKFLKKIPYVSSSKGRGVVYTPRDIGCGCDITCFYDVNVSSGGEVQRMIYTQRYIKMNHTLASRFNITYPTKEFFYYVYRFDLSYLNASKQKNVPYADVTYIPPSVNECECKEYPFDEAKDMVEDDLKLFTTPVTFDSVTTKVYHGAKYQVYVLDTKDGDEVIHLEYYLDFLSYLSYINCTVVGREVISTFVRVDMQFHWWRYEFAVDKMFPNCDEKFYEIPANNNCLGP